MGAGKYIFSRIGNTIRCYASYALSLTGLVHVRHMPLFLSVEPANICQLKCPECPIGIRNRDHEAKRNGTPPLLSRELWRHILAEAKPWVWTIQFYFQGEPLLHPGLAEMIADARREGIYTIVSTNAQAMTPGLATQLMQSGLNRIIVSMDGITQESYSAYRIGGKLSQCLSALAWLREAKQQTGAHCIIELQCLKLRSNEHEWKLLRGRYKALGADRLSLKSAQLYDYEDGHPLMPSQDKDRRYEQDKMGKWHRKPLPHSACKRAWQGVVITTDGDVLPCCYDKEHAHAYGKIGKESLQHLFHNQKADAFRHKAIAHRHAICQNCWQ